MFEATCVLYYIALHCIVLYCIALHCIVLHCIVLYCIALYCIVLYWCNWLVLSPAEQTASGSPFCQAAIRQNLPKLFLSGNILVKTFPFWQYFLQNFFVLAIFVSKLFLSGNLSSVKTFQNFSPLAFFCQSICHGLYSAVIALAKPLFLFFSQYKCQSHSFPATHLSNLCFPAI